jgi:hypothetical protein
MSLPRKMWASLLFGVAIASGMAQTTKLRIVPVKFGKSLLPAEVQMFCTENYPRAFCLRDAATLHRALARYPSPLLGEWSFVLVPASDWKDLLGALGRHEDTPAFTILDAHATMLESSLFTATPDRQKELLEEFGLSGAALLELAVSHELVHGVCMEKDERRIESERENMREGKRLECGRILAEAAHAK